MARIGARRAPTPPRRPGSVVGDEDGVPPRCHPRRGVARAAAVAAAVLAATVAAGCTGGATGTPPSPSTPVAASRPIVVNALEFRRSLLPADTDGYGLRIAGLLFRGLLVYDAKGKAVPEVAESIETSDDRSYEVRLRSGWRFSDGEPVSAASFVGAWNLARDPTRGYRHTALFAPLVDVRVVDEQTFTFTLDAPTPGFTDRLGHVAFAPLPARAVADPAAFALSPVGNGPYALDGPWRTGSRIGLRPSGAYVGADPARNAGIEFRIYADLARARADLEAGTLDVLDEMPVADLPTYRDTFGQRALYQPVGRTISLTFPVRNRSWLGERGRAVRAAVSQAIDREDIAAGVFAGTREAATDLAAPVVEGHSRSLCGALCAYDPVAARAELATGGGLPEGLSLGYAADEGQSRWADALCDDIARTLDIPCQPRSFPTRPALWAAVAAGAHTGPFLVTREMSYPALASFLSPRFVPATGDNDSGYGSPAVTRALADAAHAPRNRQVAAYTRAEELILSDLPVVPLWSANATGAVAPGLEGAHVDVFGAPRYAQIRRV